MRVIWLVTIEPDVKMKGDKKVKAFETELDADLFIKQNKRDYIDTSTKQLIELY